MSAIATLAPVFAYLAPRAIASLGLGVLAAIADRLLPPTRLRALRASLWWMPIAVFAVPAQQGGLAVGVGLPHPGGDDATAGIAGLLWASVAFAALLRLCLHAAAERRRLRRCSRSVSSPRIEAALAAAAIAVGLRRAPPWRLATGRGACVTGILAPRIQVGRGLGAMSPSELDCVLVHECAHVRRRDALRAAVVEVLRALLWFAPAVHLAARRLRVLREVETDALAIRSLEPSRIADYRGVLADAARELLTRASVAFGEAGLVTRLRVLALPIRRVRRAEKVASLSCAALLLFVTAPRSAMPAAVPQPGCLRTHYAVLAALAADGADDLDPSSPTPESR